MKQENRVEACCITQCEVPMNREYWETRWEKQETRWDIGYAAPALTKYIDGIADKDTAVLIPGCGNAYEAEYLLNNGFTNITLIDIAQGAIGNLKRKFEGNKALTIICEDFFEHKGRYDLVLEQTFFSAIPPFKRRAYAAKMHEILTEKGRVVGVLFDEQFNNPFPPFGGCPCEYRPVFEPYFTIEKMETCYNSIESRKDREVFINLLKKK